MMPPEIQTAFLEAFSRFPNITFLWKYERPEDKINSNYSNVILEKWWPQSNLLGHPKLLAFITHGGMNSVSEASYAGAPLVVIPLFADQHRNAHLVEYREIGIRLNVADLNADTIAAAIQKIVDNKGYKQKATELSKLMHSKPYSAEERFVRFSEFATQYDLHSRLDLAGRHLNSFTFYNLDVFIFMFSVVLFVIFAVFILLRMSWRFVRRCFVKNAGKKSKKE